VTLLEARTSSDDELLDMDGVAALLRISKAAVRTRYYEGKLPKRIPASTQKKPLWRKRDLIG